MNARAAMCEGKAPLTWCEAIAILARYRSREKRRSLYHCPMCRAWHLGRHPKKIRRA